LCGNTT